MLTPTINLGQIAASPALTAEIRAAVIAARYQAIIDRMTMRISSIRNATVVPRGNV